jgi:hypothetical protein
LVVALMLGAIELHLRGPPPRSVPPRRAGGLAHPEVRLLLGSTQT